MDGKFRFGSGRIEGDRGHHDHSQSAATTMDTGRFKCIA